MMDPAGLEPVGAAFARVEWQGDSFLIEAAARTDAFSPPDGGPAVDRLGGLRLRLPEGAWQVAAFVEPAFATTFDAGALVLRCDAAADQTSADQTPPDQTSADQTSADQTSADQTSAGQTPAGQTPADQPAAWAKLAYERAPDGRAMAVSVVTRGLSDDCNGPAFAGPGLWLRACSTGQVCAFHTSTDGQRWDLLRLFALPGRVGMLDLIAQSPMGEGCRVRFSGLQMTASAPQDMRDGS